MFVQVERLCTAGRRSAKYGSNDLNNAFTQLLRERIVQPRIKDDK